MLVARPEVHGKRPELYLDRQLIAFGGQIDRHLDDQVQGTVSTGFGLLDIVFLRHQDDVILLEEIVPEQVQVVKKGTDHPQAGDIGQFPDALDGQGEVPALKLLDDGKGFLQPAMDRLDRIEPTLLLGKFDIEDIQLGLHRQHRRVVAHHQMLEVLEILENRDSVFL